MFGLPIETLLLIFGFPLLWIAYLIVFMLVTRNWNKDTAAEDESS